MHTAICKFSSTSTWLILLLTNCKSLPSVWEELLSSLYCLKSWLHSPTDAIRALVLIIGGARSAIYIYI